jgi:hypothetical protein
VAVESGERGEGAALDLDDRDPEARGVEDEPLERLAALRYDEQPDRRPPGNEGLLDRATTRDELLARLKQLRPRCEDLALLPGRPLGRFLCPPGTRTERRSSG